MSEPQPLERPQLLTDKVCDRLREAIVRGELKLGEQVSEVQLATWLGVSKTPVRESLLRLKAEGLVEIQPQRGTFVFQLDAAQVAQLCHYRAMIEVAALRSALTQHPAGLESGLEACVSEMREAEKAKDLQALAQIDMDFHHQFFVHCGDPYLRAGYAVIRSQLVALRFRSPIRNAISSHQVLLEAVRRRRVDKACALLHEHVLENEARYRTACSVGCVDA
jgi:DNA-binding GntR family transcriptional regulator